MWPLGRRGGGGGLKQRRTMLGGGKGAAQEGGQTDTGLIDLVNYQRSTPQATAAALRLARLRRHGMCRETVSRQAKGEQKIWGPMRV